MRVTSRSLGEVLAVANLYVIAVLYADGIEMVLYYIPPLMAAIAGVLWSVNSPSQEEDRNKSNGRRSMDLSGKPGRNEALRFIQIVAPEMSRTPKQQERVIDWAARFINCLADQAGLASARQRTFEQLVETLDKELTAIERWKQQLHRTPSWRQRMIQRMLRAPFLILRRRRKRLQAAYERIQQLEKDVSLLETEIASEQVQSQKQLEELSETVTTQGQLVRTMTERHAAEILQLQEQLSIVSASNEQSQKVAKSMSNRLDDLHLSLANVATHMRRHLPDAPLLDSSSLETLLQTIRLFHDFSLETSQECKREASKSRLQVYREAERLRQDLVEARNVNNGLQRELELARSESERVRHSWNVQLEEACASSVQLEQALADLRVVLSNKEAAIEELHAEVRQAYRQAADLQQPTLTPSEQVARYLVQPDSCPELIHDTMLLVEADLPLETRVALLHHMCLEPDWALAYLAELSAAKHTEMCAALIRMRPEMLEMLLWNAASANEELLGFACAVLGEWKPQKEDLLSPIDEFPPLTSGGSLLGLEAIAFWGESEQGWPMEMRESARSVFLDLLRTLSEFDRSSNQGLLRTIESHLLQFTEALQCKW